MFEKAKLMFDIYRAGSTVASDLAMKKTQLTVNALSVFLVAVAALLKAYNVQIPLDDSQISNIAGTLFIIIGLFNTHHTLASTDKFGVLPPTEPANVPTGIPISIQKVPATDASEAVQPVAAADAPVQERANPDPFAGTTN